MGFAASIASDQAMMDWPQTVSYFDRSAGKTYSGIASVQKRDVTRREVAQSQGYLDGEEVVFEIMQSVLTPPPAEGDQVIEANGATWDVLIVARNVWGTVWDLTCKQER